jgi:hypothetical protein
MYFHNVCEVGLTKKAEPPPTRDVNRDSGTDSDNGGWLRRLVRHQRREHNNKMKNKILTLYIIIAVITFGHAWNRISPTLPPTAKDGVCFFSIASSALWPLYWSTVAWKS